MRVLLDTNMLVSALLEDGGYPARVVGAWREKRYALVTSPALLDEFRRVVQYGRLTKRLRGREKEVAVLAAGLEILAAQSEGKLSLSVLTDPDDSSVLAAAVEGSADYLVTGNKHHFDELGGSYQGIEILSPREF